MNQEIIATLHSVLDAIHYPDTKASLQQLLVGDLELKSLGEGGFDLAFDVLVPVTAVAGQLASAVQRAAEARGVLLRSVALGQKIQSGPAANTAGKVQGVKNIIAVASGKGGVGKSTTSVNLALALAAEGARVGVLDADIYGPSQPQMLGVGGVRPEIQAGKVILPVLAHGLQMISMGNMLTDDTPVIWRGPMVSGALQQLLQNTQWDDVDYLIIDMPPGTGDIPLTLSQKVPVTGSVIVTTPQDIALLDAKKGIEMFRKVNIPVYGVVENMAVHICSQCGHEEHIFGANGGRALAEQYGVETLGQLPLLMSIREQTDAGTPPLVADSESTVSNIYRSIARKVAFAVSQSGSNAGPEIIVTND